MWEIRARAPFPAGKRSSFCSCAWLSRPGSMEWTPAFGPAPWWTPEHQRAVRWPVSGRSSEQSARSMGAPCSVLAQGLECWALSVHPSEATERPTPFYDAYKKNQLQCTGQTRGWEDFKLSVVWILTMPKRKDQVCFLPCSSLRAWRRPEWRRDTVMFKCKNGWWQEAAVAAVKPSLCFLSGKFQLSSPV